MISILTIFSCKNDADSVFVNVSGNLKNVNIDSIYFVINNREKAVALDNDGNFSDTIQLKNEGFFTFSDGRNEFPVYLIPGDHLVINADYLDLENTLKFTGDGEVRNNFLLQKENKIAEYLADEKTFYSREPNDYKSHVKVIYNEFVKDLEAIEPNIGISFFESEKKNLHYDYVLNLLTYKDAYAYFNGKLPDLPSDFKKEIEAIDINNEADYVKYPAYRYLVSNILDERLKSETLPEIVKTIKSQKVKDQFFVTLIDNINQNSTESELIYQVITKNTENPKIIQAANDARDKLLSSKKVTVSNFSYQNEFNKPISSDDFKGKLIYIDLWATWCRPCFMEFPYMKILAEEYKDKDIVFLGISIDSEKDKLKWKSTLREQKFSYPQVFAGAENVENDFFLTELNIRYIPRFILIGKDGKIISSEAPTPSNPSLKKLINQNL